MMGYIWGTSQRAGPPNPPAFFCLVLPQEHAPLPADITRLFADSLFTLSTAHVPHVAALRRQLTGSGGGGREPLALWRPQLDVPFPPLEPAVFEPAWRGLPPPALELFDLEEELAGPLVGGC